ncbi:MAG: hypothetical protein IJY80_03620, partial [Opitutales bacterium]|nr:hypothetical protein [Opitutales bacterium]
MIYLSQFHFPSALAEDLALGDTFDTEYYPFRILSKREFYDISFDQLTFLYGGNGSGKTTALNVIAETLNLSRSTPYNRSDFFGRYTNLCHYSTENKIPASSLVITSDDIFDYMLNLRVMNQAVDDTREDIAKEYLSLKHSKIRLRSMADYEEFSRYYEAKKSSQ